MPVNFGDMYTCIIKPDLAANEGKELTRVITNCLERSNFFGAVYKKWFVALEMDYMQHLSKKPVTNLYSSAGI
jgi:hypothetical protein